MKKMNDAVKNLKARAVVEWNRLKYGERGDTNFISMLLIIAIVVVLAGAFMVLGEDIMDAVSTKIRDFLDSL